MNAASLPKKTRRIFQKIETWVGLACAFFLSLFVVTIGVLTIINKDKKNSDFQWELAASILAILIESIFVCVMSDRLKFGWLPFAPQFALSLRRWPLILRPIVGVWWAIHFLFGVGIALMIEGAAAHRSNGLSLWAQIAIFFAISFSLAYALNFYAMLTLTAFGAGERVIQFAWKWRALLDFTIAAAASILVLAGKF